jgi:hypothetical protein
VRPSRGAIASTSRRHLSGQAIKIALIRAVRRTAGRELIVERQVCRVLLAPSLGSRRNNLRCWLSGRVRRAVGLSRTPKGGRNAVTDVTENLLRELVAWTRFANRAALVDALRETMADPRHLRAFEATDGTKSQDEVAAFAGASQATVSGLWARWRRLGLADVTGGRAKHLVRPSDLGIEIPPPTTKGSDEVG